MYRTCLSSRRGQADSSEMPKGIPRWHCARTEPKLPWQPLWPGVCCVLELMAAAGSHPPEVVGFILSKVQEDLARLKDEVSRSVSAGGAVDALAVKAALESTQKELQMHAETTLQLIQDKAATLPHIVQPLSRSSRAGGSKRNGGSSRRCACVRACVCCIA